MYVVVGALCLQVSGLEQQLERARVSLQEELSKRQEDNQVKEKKLREINQQNERLSESVR